MAALLVGAPVGLGAMAWPGDASAHVVNQSLSTSVPSNFKVDVYRLNCGSGSATARVRVLDLGGVDRVRFTTVVSRSGVAPASSTTAPDGGVSTQAVVFGASGASFIIDVTKSGGGIEPYQLRADCHTSTGALASHALFFVQNQ